MVSSSIVIELCQRATAAVDSGSPRKFATQARFGPQDRSSRSRTTVTTAEIRRDDRQPSRFEKRTNIGSGGPVGRRRSPAREVVGFVLVPPVAPASEETGDGGDCVEEGGDDHAT